MFQLIENILQIIWIVLTAEYMMIKIYEIIWSRGIEHDKLLDDSERWERIC